jgi:hypothetical protein
MTVGDFSMKALSPTQAQQWCSKFSLEYDGIGTDFLHPQPDGTPFQFRIPEDAGRRIALCKVLLKPLRGQPILIWYADWSVWPSGEWLPMFDRFRQAFQIQGSLKELPAYLFDECESDDAVSFFIWAALFLWDCHVIAGNHGYSVFLSHDEIGYSRFNSKLIESLKLN